ncbi:MAG: TonB-dependent receptor [Prevotella sp.]|jgi:outer membrane receptor protein involved in Fe transport
MYKLLAISLLAISLSASAQNDSVVALNNVVVTGTRNATDVRHIPMTVTVVDRKSLTQNHQTNILPTLSQQVPGLFVTSRAPMGYGVSANAAGGINLRGIAGGGGQLLVLIDGHPQYQGIYGHPISDSYQTMMANRVEVLRGPASVLYGSNAMGGVINIVTRTMHQDGSKTHLDLGAGSYGTVQTELSNQYRKGKFSSTVAAQYARSDNHRPKMGFEQYGGYLKLDYDINDHWHSFANANITHFNASNPGSVDKPLYDSRQWITRGVATIGVENHYGHTSGTFSLYHNFGRHKINDGTDDDTKPQTRYFRSKDALTGLSWFQSAQLYSGNRVTIGFDYQHIYGRAFYTSIATGEVLDTPNKQSGHSHRNEVAGYIDFRQDLTPWLILDAGIRLDHHSVTGNEWIPQAGIVVRPTETGELKLQASKGFRNPTMRELYLYPPSNMDLEPERLWNYELSWSHRLLDNRLNYGLNLFYLNGDNMIQTVMQDGRPRNVNTGEIKNYGIELQADYRINGHWTINTNHSLLHMKHHVLAAPRYKGFAGVSFTQNKWTANVGLQYINGLYTAVGANEKQESFWLLNATLAYQLYQGVRLWISGENLLAQKYEIIAGFPMPRATVMAGVSISF